MTNLAYSYVYTSAARVALYGNIAEGAIPDIMAEDGEEMLSSALRKAGIDPSGITVTGNLKLAATFYICYLLAKGDKIKLRGPDIASESGGGVGLSYVAPKDSYDWMALAEKLLEEYLDSYVTDQPRKQVLARANYEVRGWETEEKTQFDVV